MVHVRLYDTDGLVAHVKSNDFVEGWQTFGRLIRTYSELETPIIDRIEFTNDHGAVWSVAIPVAADEDVTMDCYY